MAFQEFSEKSVGNKIFFINFCFENKFKSKVPYKI